MDFLRFLQRRYGDAFNSQSLQQHQGVHMVDGAFSQPLLQGAPFCRETLLGEFFCDSGPGQARRCADLSQMAAHISNVGLLLRTALATVSPRSAPDGCKQPIDFLGAVFWGFFFRHRSQAERRPQARCFPAPLGGRTREIFWIFISLSLPIFLFLMTEISVILYQCFRSSVFRSHPK